MKPHHFSYIATRNAQDVLQALQQTGPCSRAMLAQVTGLSRPTISQAAQRLESLQLIRATDRRTRGQGRAGIIYEMNDAHGVVVSVALDSQHGQIAFFSLSGAVLFEQCFVITSEHDKTELLALLEQGIETGMADTGLPILAIGISVAAPVDPDNHQVVQVPLLPFAQAGNTPFKQHLEDCFRVPCVIDNDVNWAALAEARRGSATHYHHFICIYLGRGIGAGIYLGGQLIKGSNGLAGELGYVKVDGRTNLQDFVSTAFHGAPENWQADQVDQAIRHIAHVLGTAVIMLNPDALILTGPLCQYSALLEQLTANIKQEMLRPLPLHISEMPARASLDGAASGAYFHYLTQLGFTL
ncbi:ROK family transcriptional regulator [Salinimonas lutimaris]|uniref:ROK family transcriptional regulator n=1 Tax=Salinimonas lutimaris TaxID=914153 RepID=UPI0010BFC8A0|nr:ROK family transcriptional regulator [Salinimonas lutimaris]